MGSVPLNTSRLFLVSSIIEIISVIIGFIVFSSIENCSIWIMVFFLLPGFIYYSHIHKRYRNDNARHMHEKETKNTISNLKSNDSFLEERKRLSSSTINGKNNNLVSRNSVKVQK